MTMYILKIGSKTQLVNRTHDYKENCKKYGSVYSDLSCAKYVNINLNRVTFVVNNKLFVIDDQK